MKQSQLLALMRENVAYKLRQGRGNEAIATLERLRKYVDRLRLLFHTLSFW